MIRAQILPLETRFDDQRQLAYPELTHDYQLFMLPPDNDYFIPPLDPQFITIEFLSENAAYGAAGVGGFVYKFGNEGLLRQALDKWLAGDRQAALASLAELGSLHDEASKVAILWHSYLDLESGTDLLFATELTSLV